MYSESREKRKTQQRRQGGGCREPEPRLEEEANSRGVWGGGVGKEGTLRTDLQTKPCGVTGDLDQTVSLDWGLGVLGLVQVTVSNRRRETWRIDAS